MSSLVFKGRDYTKISDCLKEGLLFMPGRALSVTEQLRIITKFIDQSRDKLDAISVAPGVGKHIDKKWKDLYEEFNGDYYWAGLVGIIKGKIDISESELNPFIDPATDKQYTDIDITIQIQSRFDLDGSGNPSKPYFLSTMLLNDPLGFKDNFVPNNSEDFFFDLLLIYLFKEQAKACYFKGPYKTYHRFERNDDRMKGSIDIARHLKLNMGMQNGKIAYSFRENSIDNYANHLVLAAFEYIKRKYPDAVNSVFLNKDNCGFKGLIDIIKSNIDYPKYDIQTLIGKNLSTISHPYYTEYEALRKTSLKILRNEGVSFFDGTEEEVTGLLVYIPDLWEKYLEHILEDPAYGFTSQAEFRVFSHPLRKGDFIEATRPDYVFYNKKDGKPFMILDGKFKPVWGDVTSGKERSLTAILGDYDKCIRDMNTISGHATGVIFPTNNQELLLNTENYISHAISELNAIDLFYTFPVFVPNSDSAPNYTSWKKNYELKNEKNFKLIREKIKSEMARSTTKGTVT